LSIQYWQALIDAEHAQSDRMRGSPQPADTWSAQAQAFRADPRRSHDPLVNRLLQEIAPHHTLIDVGAGGGRLTFPLALRCRRVIAVEPSPSMRSVLRQQMLEAGISNVSLVALRWEEAEIDPADFVLCAHVLYTIRDIVPFVRKLEAHARERVLVVLFQDAPQARIHPLWARIHGERRRPLPSLPEFQAVLRELGIEAQTEALPPQPPRGFDSLEDALRQLSRRLYLKPDDAKTSQLEQMLPELLEEVDGVLQLRGTGLFDTALVGWHPISGDVR
jgi:SAM-dependent methyltransferase